MRGTRQFQNCRAFNTTSLFFLTVSKLYYSMVKITLLCCMIHTQTIAVFRLAWYKYVLDGITNKLR